MFGFLKDKLKSAVEKFSKKVDEFEDADIVEKTEEEIIEEEIEKEKKEQKKKEKKEIIKKVEDELKKEKLIEEIQSKGFLEKVKEKVTTKIISESQFEEIFQDLQLVLLENNVALDVVDKIKNDLKEDLMDRPIKRMQVEEQVREALKNSLQEILTPPEFSIQKVISVAKKESRPAVILIIGYNGAGKSLTTAKLAYHFKQKGYNPILAAGDTFRAAGAVQLVEYGKIVQIPVIHDSNTKDSCSVIFEAIKHAKSKHYDLVIADTSGRIQNNKDLMDELKKISRVNNPDATLLVVDSLTGSDVVMQVDQFDKNIAIDGLVLTKVDVDDKGGAFLSAVFTGKKPILYICNGQGMNNIEEYDPEKILKHLGL